MPDRAYFENRLAELREESKRALAQFQALDGARQETENTLRQFDAETAAAPAPLTVVPPPSAEREES